MRKLVAFPLVAAGCLGPLSLPSFDAGPHTDAAIAFLGVEARDVLGEVRPLDALPRVPLLRLRATPALAAPDAMDPAVLLLHGAPDDALRADLDARPLRSDTLVRTVPCRATRDHDGALVLEPTPPLAPNEDVTIAIAPWARTVDGRTLGLRQAIAAHVSASPDDGARVIDAWPADGTAGVPCALAQAVLRFDGQVDYAEDGVALVDPDGDTVSATISEQPCASIGFRDTPSRPTFCIAVTPTESLMPGAPYTLVTRPPLQDRRGAGIESFAAHFTTEDACGATAPVRLAGETCAIDEAAVATDTGSLCVLVDDTSLTVHGQATAPAAAFVMTPTASSRMVAMDGAFALRVGALRTDADVPLALTLVDAAGRRTSLFLPLRTTPALATLSITEVRANPHGAEPAQEYVELANYGDASIDLAGMTLGDRLDAPGDALAAARLLPAGARVLLVADSFDAADTSDDHVPPGTLLVRIGSSLGSGGLPARGAGLYLRDATGHRLSASPGLEAPEGDCIVRATGEPRDGSAGTFAIDTLGCTPGMPDRTPGS